jgi:CBS domain-containing protein
MKLGELSTRDVFYVAPEDPVAKAVAIMEEHGFHHLPVLATGQVVGMVSDRDLLMVGAGQERKSKKRAARQPSGPLVAEIMSQPVFALAPDDTLRSATWLMVTHRVHAIPLIRGDRLVGLVTEFDILRGVIASPAFSQLDDGMLERQPVTSRMRGKLKTVSPKTSIDDVVSIMCKEQIRHLPVVIAEELLGIVSDRDVRRALGRAAALDAKAQKSGKLYLGPSEVCEVMTNQVQTIPSTATTEMVIEELLRHKVHCLPVVENGRLLGMITDTDLLRAIGAAEKDAGQKP